MFFRRSCLVLFTFFCLFGFNSFSETPEDRDERMEWWREARFGMFVHWGLYSIPAGEWDGRKFGGGVEWIQNRAGVPAKKYSERLLPKFKPKKDLAKEWAKTAKSAGCKYLVFTTKHHEGFALHDSAVTEFDAKDVCGRDLVKEIVDACRAEGLKIGFYHSVIDWHHPHAYVGMGLPSIKGDTNEGRDHSKYVEFLHAQAEELVTKYGPVDVIWWDYSSRQVQGESWKAKGLMKMVKKHQPQVIMNNRLFAKNKTGGATAAGFDLSHGDFITPEQKIPATGLGGVDWETCMTMNGTWGYSAHDKNWKSSTTLLRNLIDIASKGGNYLLNIGPMADGTVPDESIQRMNEIGAWLKVNGEAVYGTNANPAGKVKWGRITSKPGVLYLHVFNKTGKINVPVELIGKGTARALADNDKKLLPIKAGANEIEIDLSEVKFTDPATVIVLEGKVEPIAGIRANISGSILLTPTNAILHGSGLTVEQKDGATDNIGSWMDSDAWVEWKDIKVAEASNYSIELTYGLAKNSTGSKIKISINDTPFDVSLKSTGTWGDFETIKVGEIQLKSNEKIDCNIRALKLSGEAVANIQKLKLVKIK